MSAPARLTLRYHPLAAWIGLLYLALLIGPWIALCILRYRQVEQSSFNGLDQTAMTNLKAGVKAIEVLNWVAAIVGLPVIYALLARAAVVSSQRTRPTQRLNAAQVYDLADGRWISKTVQGVNVSALTRPAALLCLLGEPIFNRLVWCRSLTSVS